MKLKDKFKTINCKDCDIPYCDTKCTILAPSELIKLEQIAEEFAIGFAEWSVARALGCDVFDLNKDELKIYKKEKKL
jgi:hypothetical protein